MLARARSRDKGAARALVPRTVAVAILTRLTRAPHAAYGALMPRMIQIRHVPVRLHQLLKTRAARAGMTLSDYLRGELERAASRAADWRHLDFPTLTPARTT